MPHYVCPACGSTAESMQACNTQGCNMIGRDMMECHCSDDQHGEVMGRATV